MDDIIKLKFGRLVEEHGHISYISNRVLGKLFKISGVQVRQLYLRRFQKIKDREMPLMTRLQKSQKYKPRQRYGLRFLLSHEIKWLVSDSTLKK